MFESLYDLSLVLLLIIPTFLSLSLLVRYLLTVDKGKPVGAFSRSLKFFLHLIKVYIYPIFKGIISFCRYIFERKAFVYLILVTWFLNLNIITLALELLGFYFYFISSFDFLSLPGFLLKVIFDVFIMFFGLPFLCWLIIGLGIYVYISFQKGYAELRHIDAKNCGALKEISYVSLLIGAPGVGKTTLLTSFCLYFVNIFKTMSLDTLYDIELLFPGFPFVKFRQALDERIRSHLIYTIPSCDLYVDELEAVYKATPALCELFGYDIEMFAMDKNVGHRVTTLFGALRTYAKAYFIYRSENPSVSNYPIRFDGKFDDSSYFPMWDGDFYSRSPREADKLSYYSHILDQDILRMGKRVDPHNPNIGCFSFGIWSNSEWGKCRGNQLTTADLDKADSIANQKNDLYAYSHKMARHANTTVDNKVYFRFIGDEQRPQSLAADQRDLCDILSIVEKSEIKLALPGFGWLDWVYKKIYDPFKDFYLEYSNARGDMILSVFLLKTVVSVFSWAYSWIYNRFGYYTIKIMKEKGTAYGDSKDGAEPDYIEYNLPVMQVYSKRYSTDCYSGFFTKKQLDCVVGINDLECYTGLTMNEEQMDKQHDYFLMEIKGMMMRSVGEVPVKNKNRSKRSSDSSDFEFDVQSF